MDGIRSCEGCTASPDEASVRRFNRHILGLHELGFHILKRLIIPIDSPLQSPIGDAATALEQVDPLGQHVITRHRRPSITVGHAYTPHGLRCVLPGAPRLPYTSLRRLLPLMEFSQRPPAGATLAMVRIISCLSYLSYSTLAFMNRQGGEMSLRIDDLCESACYRRRTSDAAPARSHLTGLDPFCATLFASGLGPRASLALECDTGSQDTHDDRDAVRSTHKHVIRCFGLKWVAMMLLIPVPWSRRRL